MAKGEKRTLGNRPLTSERGRKASVKLAEQGSAVQSWVRLLSAAAGSGQDGPGSLPAGHLGALVLGYDVLREKKLTILNLVTIC